MSQILINRSQNAHGQSIVGAAVGAKNKAFFPGRVLKIAYLSRGILPHTCDLHYGFRWPC